MSREQWVMTPNSGSDAHLRNENCGVAGCRPVVVIDPEDKKAVGRLVVLLAEHGLLPTERHGVRDSLREFANQKASCDAVLVIGSERIECERDDDDHSSDHRNDSIGQGVRWSA